MATEAESQLAKSLGAWTAANKGVADAAEQAAKDREQQAETEATNNGSSGSNTQAQ